MPKDKEQWSIEIRNFGGFLRKIKL